MGRVLHDLHSQLQDIPEGTFRERHPGKLWLVGRLQHQSPKSQGMIYDLHEPKTNCISKGKARVSYEFGRKVSILTEQTPTRVVADRVYHGHGVETTRMLISRTRRGLAPLLAKLLKRRSAIEPEIGHLKSDGLLARSPLKGTFGDAIFAILCGYAHNIRKILAYIRALNTAILEAMLLATNPKTNA